MDVRKAHRYTLWACLLIPLVLTLLWGPHLTDSSHALIIAARNLSAGRAAASGLDNTAVAPLNHPLPLLLLSALDLLSVSLVSAVWILSAAGWSAAAVAVFWAARAMGYTWAAPVAAVSLGAASIPAGGGVGLDGWTIAAVWLATAAALRNRRSAAWALLLLWLGLSLDWPAWLGISAFLIDT